MYEKKRAMASPITSVQQNSRPVFFNSQYDNYSDQEEAQSALISLSVRGARFDLAREELTSLPESILLCLFPHGLMLDDHQESLINVDASHPQAEKIWTDNLV